MFVNVCVDAPTPPNKHLFTYKVPEPLTGKAKLGSKTKVPFGKKEVWGWIVSKNQKSDIKNQKYELRIKSILEISEKQKLPPLNLKLAKWMSRYYFAPLRDCIKPQLYAIQNINKTFPKLERGKIRNLILVPHLEMVEDIRRDLPKKYYQKSIIGGRSFVFAPIERLEKITIIEEENWSYKDERSPYYHALDVAVKRRELQNCKLEIVSETPRVETWYKLSAYLYPHPPTTPTDSHNHPQHPQTLIKVIDMKKERDSGNFSPFSQKALTEIASQKRVALFALSKNTYASANEFIKKTKVNEDLVKTLIHGAYIPKKQTFDTIVVLDTDTALNLPDFRASERLVQTATRLSKHTGLLLLQTSNPLSEIFEIIKTKKLEKFYKQELKTRESFGFCPFCKLAKLSITYKTRAKSFEHAGKMYESIKELTDKVKVYQPVLAYNNKQGSYTCNIIVKAKKREELDQVLNQVPQPWKIIINPKSLL